MATFPTFTPVANPTNVQTLYGWEARDYSFKGDGVFVMIEGDSAPRGFRGTRKSYEYPLTAVWPQWAGPLARAFLDMLETAYASAEARIVVAHSDKFGLEFVSSSMVEIHDWSGEIRKPSGISAISFVMTQVR